MNPLDDECYIYRRWSPYLKSCINLHHLKVEPFRHSHAMCDVAGLLWWRKSSPDPWRWCSHQPVPPEMHCQCADCVDRIRYLYLMIVEENINGCVSVCHTEPFFFFFFIDVVSIKWRSCWAKIELGLKQIWKSKSHYTWRKSVGDFCGLSSISANWQNQMGGPGASVQAEAHPCFKRDLQGERWQRRQEREEDLAWQQSWGAPLAFPLTPRCEHWLSMASCPEGPPGSEDTHQASWMLLANDLWRSSTLLRKI